MKLFTVGPVQMLDEIKKVGGSQVPYFRTNEFSEVMIASDKLLRKFMNAPDGAKSIYLTASGTGAMEATIMNCLRQTDHVLIINGGTFGHRFVDLCKIHKIPFSTIDLDFGEQLLPEHLNKFNNEKITAVLVNANETSTGQLYDLSMLSEFCMKRGAYFIVDAISSFLIDSFDMKENHIDAVITSSQKGLCIAPGLSTVVLSDRLITERVKLASIDNLYFRFTDYLSNMERGQTPYTPCVGICMEMHKALQIIDKQGLDSWLMHIDEVAKDFRSKVKILPISIPNYPLGNAVTPICFHQPIAKKVFEVLKNQYDVFVNPTGGAQENYILRIAHIGDTSKDDNTYLIELMDKVISKIESEQ